MTVLCVISNIGGATFVIQSHDCQIGKGFARNLLMYIIIRAATFGFQHVLIRNIQTKIFWVEYWVLPG